MKNFASGALTDLLLYVSSKLKSSFSNSNQVAIWLLEKLFGCDWIKLLKIKSIELSSDKLALLDSWIKCLVEENYPLQYLIGSMPFLNLQILVEPPILIPRPETEEWLFQLIKILESKNKKELCILDIGTGSGCIALALAKVFPMSKVIAIDINKHALTLAGKNKLFNKLTNVEIIESDCFNQISDKKFDLIISNPPYISIDQYKKLDPTVLKWEDEKALTCEDDGLAIIKKVICEAPEYLKRNNSDIPSLVLEIDYQQSKSVQNLMKQSGFESVQIWKDFAGKDRTVIGF